MTHISPKYDSKSSLRTNFQTAYQAFLCLLLVNYIDIVLYWTCILISEYSDGIFNRFMRQSKPLDKILRFHLLMQPEADCGTSFSEREASRMF